MRKAGEHALIQELNDLFNSSQALVLYLAWDLSCAQHELQEDKLLPPRQHVHVKLVEAGSALGRKVAGSCAGACCLCLVEGLPLLQ